MDPDHGSDGRRTHGSASRPTTRAAEARQGTEDVAAFDAPIYQEPDYEVQACEPEVYEAPVYEAEPFAPQTYAPPAHEAQFSAASLQEVSAAYERRRHG